MILTSITLVLHRSQPHLRFYANDEKRLKSLSHLIKGDFVPEHWDKSSSCIYIHVPNAVSNNAALYTELAKYIRVRDLNESLTPDELAHYFDESKKTENPVTIGIFLKKVMDSYQTENRELFKKLYNRLKEFNPKIDFLSVDKLNYDFCESFRNFLVVDRNGACYRQYSANMTTFINKLDKDRSSNWDRSRIEGYSFSANAPKKITADEDNEGVDLPNWVLEEWQIWDFVHLDLSTVAGRIDPQRVELYHDFLVFMFHTYMRPADAMRLKYNKIIRLQLGEKRPHINYRPYKLRGKDVKAAQVYFTPTAMQIIEKYRGQSADGYVFPLLDSERATGYKNGLDGLTKTIRQNINTWLLKVADVMGIEKHLHMYTFRHTAISYALHTLGYYVAFVAQSAGTSIEMISRHYNNNSLSDVAGVDPMEKLTEKFEGKKLDERAIFASLAI
ncbi:MAG: Phage integrase family [Bacteroidetes bacterium]|nr:Phage integrase family [Bacteroidota bacterium]